MDADWDLQAVVRGCSSAVSSATTTTTTAPAWPVQQNSTFKGFFPDLFQPRTHNSIEHLLTDLYNPPPPSPQSFPISPLSVLAGLQDPPHHHHHHHHQQPKQFQGIRQQPLGISRCTTSHAPKFKKRLRRFAKCLLKDHLLIYGHGENMVKNPSKALLTQGGIINAALQRVVWPENKWSGIDPTQEC